MKSRFGSLRPTLARDIEIPPFSPYRGKGEEREERKGERGREGRKEGERKGLLALTRLF